MQVQAPHLLNAVKEYINNNIMVTSSKTMHTGKEVKFGNLGGQYSDPFSFSYHYFSFVVFVCMYVWHKYSI